MNLLAAVGLLRRYFAVAVLAALLGGGLAFLAMKGPESFVSRTDVLMAPADPAERAVFLEQPERYVASQTAVATSLKTARAAARSLEGVTPEEIEHSVSATAVTNSNVVRIAVEAEEARRSELLARAVVAAFVGEGNDRVGQSLGVKLETKSDSALLLGFGTLVGAFAGFLLVLMTAQLFQRMSPRIVDVEDLQPELRTKVLGGVPLRLKPLKSRRWNGRRRPARPDRGPGSVDRLAVELALRLPASARIGVAGLSSDSGADVLIRQLSEAMTRDDHRFSSVSAVQLLEESKGATARTVGVGALEEHRQEAGVVLVDATAISPLRLVALLDELDVLLMVGRLRRDRKADVEEQLEPLLRARQEVWSVWFS